MIKLVAPYKVTDIDNATIQEVKEYLKDQPRIGFDIETKAASEYIKHPDAGLDPYLTEILSIQVGDEGIQYVIDARFTLIGDLKEIAKLIKDIPKVGANLKFDYKFMLHNFGYKWENPQDIFLAEKVLYQGLKTEKRFFGLDTISSRYLSSPIENMDKSIRLNFKEIGYRAMTREEIVYSAEDIRIALIVHDAQSSRQDYQDMIRAIKIENNFLLVLAELELRGFYLDVDLWLENAQRYKIKLGGAIENLHKYLQEHKLDDFLDINWNSSAQVIELFKVLDIPVDIIDLDKSTEEETVYKHTVAETHISKFKKKYDIIPLYLEYKHIYKLVSSYGETFLKHVNPETGRVHSNYFQILNTGRMSSNKPNLQNIPSEDKRAGFRSCFIAPPEKILIVADYSGQEQRVLASKAKEDVMLQFFNSDDTDMHSYLARLMFKTEVSKQVRPDLRFIAKIVSFSIAYGAGPRKIASTLSIPIKEAKKLIEDFYNTYPQLKKYFSRTYHQSLNRGYIHIDDVTSRRAYLPAQEEFNRLRAKYRSCILYGGSLEEEEYANYRKYMEQLKRCSQNWPIQGVSGMMTKLAGILFKKSLLEEGLDETYIVNIIHDEFVIETIPKYKEIVSRLIQTAMERAGEIFTTGLVMTAKPVITNKWEH